MKIYDLPGFPNSLRVRVVVGENRLINRVALLTVNVLAGAHRTTGFLAFNPSGTVPLPEPEAGTVPCECTAIAEFPDHFDDAYWFAGTSACAFGASLMTSRRAEANLPDIVAAYFHDSIARQGSSIGVWPNREWAVEYMFYLNDILPVRAMIAGDRYSMTDITAYAGLTFPDFVQPDVPGACGTLQAWHTRIAALRRQSRRPGRLEQERRRWN